MMIFAVLLAIFLIYLVIAISSIKIKERKLCAVCGAVSLTWISLLALTYLKLFDDKYLIAILMGQSICGAMYLFEKSAPKKLHSLKIAIILVGTLIVYYAVKSI